MSIFDIPVGRHSYEFFPFRAPATMERLRGFLAVVSSLFRSARLLRALLATDVSLSGLLATGSNQARTC
jgi:hypothetical protein